MLPVYVRWGWRSITHIIAYIDQEPTVQLWLFMPDYASSTMGFSH